MDRDVGLKNGRMVSHNDVRKRKKKFEAASSLRQLLLYQG